MEIFNLVIDTKNTIWRRCYVKIEAETLEEAINIVKDDHDCYDSELLLETECLMTPEENDGKPTIEIFDYNDNQLYHN